MPPIRPGRDRGRDRPLRALVSRSGEGVVLVRELEPGVGGVALLAAKPAGHGLADHRLGAEAAAAGLEGAPGSESSAAPQPANASAATSAAVQAPTRMARRLCGSVRERGNPLERRAVEDADAVGGHRVHAIENSTVRLIWERYELPAASFATRPSGSAEPRLTRSPTAR